MKKNLYRSIEFYKTLSFFLQLITFESRFLINIQITEEEHKKFSRTKLKYLQISMDKQEIPEQIVVNMMMIPQFTTSEGAYLAFNQLEKSVSPQS